MMMTHSFKGIFKKYLDSLGLNLFKKKSPLINSINADFLLSANEILKLGTEYGGWLIPKNISLDHDSVCYLAGAGEDISFDCALVEKFGCRIRILDPTPRSITHFQQLTLAVHKGEKFAINGSLQDFYKISQENFSKIKFLPYGLAGDDIEMKFFLPKDPSHISCSTLNLQQTDTWFTAQCYRLLTLMREQDDQNIDLLKMDIEGGEYAVIDDLVANGPLPNLLLIEFDEAHTPLDEGALNRIEYRIHALEQAGMRCIALSGCNMTFSAQY